jgi:hypothetical protein
MSKEEIIEKYSLEIDPNLIIEDTEELVTCRICGFKGKRLYGGSHFRHAHNNITSKDYRSLFNGALVTSPIDYISTTKNSGLYMKTEKYKKMFSEKFKGEKNPNHSSKTTYEYRQSLSPFSISFYERKYPSNTLLENKKLLSIFTKKAFKDRVLTTDIQYYLNQGLSPEDAKAALSKRQTTFNKEICIEKYGEVEGLKRWEERQSKWKKSLVDGGNMTSGYSKVSQELFDSIERVMGSRENFKYATKGGEFGITEGEKTYQYDFIDTENNKIIEYNGDLFHANPRMFESSDCPNPFRENLTSSEIWDYDKVKLDLADQNGYEVLVIWESDYNSDSTKVLGECVKFLSE